MCGELVRMRGEEGSSLHNPAIDPIVFLLQLKRLDSWTTLLVHNCRLTVGVLSVHRWKTNDWQFLID